MTRSVNRSAAMLLLVLCAAPAAAQSYADAAPESARSGFGTAVAVTDGEVFVGEGANVMRPGIVYVYRPRDEAWIEAARLTAPGSRRGDGFGRSLAADDGRLLVGQAAEDAPGTVHAFSKRGGEWSPDGTLSPEESIEGLRYGVALALGGGLAAVGAAGGDAQPGRVYLFRRAAGVWRPAGVLTADDARPGDGFGAAVAIEGDRVLVGAPGRDDGAGVAYLFRRAGTGAQWTQEARMTGRGIERRSAFGTSVALRGETALVSAPGFDQVAGAVFQFAPDPATGEWTENDRLRPFDGARFVRFGTSMVLSGDAAYVGAPGADDAGAIYVIHREADGRWTEAEKLLSDAVADRGGFGASLAIAGNVAVAGATNEDYGAGAAVILTRRTGGWDAVEKVVSDAEAFAAFTGGEEPCNGGRAGDTFECSNVDLLAFLPVQSIGGSRGVRVNDVWGWTDPDNGREYALVGRLDGTSFVDISDPSNPRYLGDLPRTDGSNAAVWRDIKVFRNHALIVADGAGQHGMQVFDLTRLRDVRDPVTFDVDAYYDGIASAHNIVVDTTSGFAFAVGARMGGETCGGGLHMIDVRDPERPTFAGCFADPQTGRASTGYSHDAQCVTYQGPDPDYRGREICLGANETALSVADVTDKEAPVAVARASYPNVGYTHQGWLTPDQHYFYMDDELDELQGKVSRTRTLIWDVSDLDDPQLVGTFMGTTEASDHNLYIRGDTMYQSNYQAGLRIVDIGDPRNPREVGYFDTVPYGTDTPGFGGSWSNYPFFPSGTIIVTSGREGLFILRKREPVS